MEACPPTVQDYVDQESRPRLEPPRVPSSTLPQIGYCLPKERHIYVSKTLPRAFSNRLLFPPCSGWYTIRSRHTRPQKSHGRRTTLIENEAFSAVQRYTHSTSLLSAGMDNTKSREIIVFALHQDFRRVFHRGFHADSFAPCGSRNAAILPTAAAALPTAPGRARRVTPTCLCGCSLEERSTSATIHSLGDDGESTYTLDPTTHGGSRMQRKDVVKTKMMWVG